ncbi:secretion protein [Flavobacterium sp. CYK-4]|uniref:reprolysin-like metallopeptidase n=1 Tax=Flavobacterium lotistagni TaxID=2709660 RepID=UPI001F2AF510|nr:zinc-dependent metalloprotease family protein [Flavobacterium lotistagni]NHM07459.1 secretion protein [Flavobacterium lotistagni]
MRKLLLLVAVLLFINSFGQNPLWNKVSEEAIKSSVKMERASMPSKFELYSLNLDLLKSLLLKAPLDADSTVSNLMIAFPNPKGELSEYRIYEAPIMEKGLADKFPDLKTYTGKNIKNPAETIRFSITVFGLHVMSLSGENGTFYIDTYSKDLKNYIVYKKQDVNPSKSFQCGVTDNSPEEFRLIQDQIEKPIQYRTSDGFFRTYRLAMACTIEFAAFHINAAGLASGTLSQKKAAVLSAMVVTMARVNGVFENDMALRMNLVANNDLIVFVESDSFDNSNSSTLINQSQTVIDAAIGSSNYDIGHTVSTGGGGLAQLNSPCGGSKARGITGQGSPVGDPFDIDYVAHEMGHQWGANHTQNNACNRNSTTAVEPGSASTIMGYAGICAPNVQNNSDAYFHTISISEMTTFISGTGGTCAVAVANGNAAPTANAGIDYTIPKGTAFILKGAGSDTNGDTLTYCWEQTNNQTSTQPPTQTATTGPNFRSITPSTSPNRYMPPLASVVANVLNPTWEVVPTVARTMNFTLTVRDNRTPNGGQNTTDDMVLTVANVGPFLVTSPNTAVSYVGNTSQTITWDVAGTTANGINCANVDILLSTNGGLTFPITLVAGTPNDGTQAVTIPNVAGTTNRIMIAGSNHIFYDVSNTNFTITAGTADTTAPTPPTLAASNTTNNATLLSWSGATDNIAVASYVIYRNGVQIGTSTATTFTVTGLSASTNYSFTVKARDADGNLSVDSNSVSVTTLANDSTPPTAPVLTNSLTGITSTFLSWTGATDNVGVVSYDVYRNGVFLVNRTTTTYLVTGLTAATAYTFFVRAKDAAGNVSSNSNVVNVTTQAPDVTPPSAPTLSASSTTSNSTVLSWSGATDNVAITAYDVYQGATLIGTTASTTYTVTGLSPLTSYSFSVKARDEAGNVSVSSNVVSITTAAFTYCTSQGNSVADELIGNVTIGTINNTSTGGTGYTDFTNLSTNLTLGSTPTISITPTWTGTVYPEGYAVYIDYNRDGDFTDAGETVYTRAASTTTPITGTFTVPLTATLGTTRMRVSLKYNGVPTACETFSYGQVEDYTVVIVPSNTTLNLKLFIADYYDNSIDEMKAVKSNQGVGSSATDVDDITVELRNASTFATDFTTTAVLQTNGTAVVTFPALSGSYYIAVKHRSAIQTWSGSAITFSTSSVSYDFTNQANKAFGSNMTQLESGVWGFYNGDINQDEVIDNSDSDTFFVDIENSNFGYLNTDLNGDGVVDNSDLDNFYINIENSVYSNHP